MTRGWSSPLWPPPAGQGDELAARTPALPHERGGDSRVRGNDRGTGDTTYAIRLFGETGCSAVVGGAREGCWRGKPVAAVEQDRG